MQAELKRSRTLTLNQLEKPYFVSYAIDEGRLWSASATNGGLITFECQQVPRSGSPYPRGRLQVRQHEFRRRRRRRRALRPGAFPLDDDPLVIRQYLWLATDSAYKGSLQQIARKRAALRSVTVSEQLPDFAPAANSRC